MLLTDEKRCCVSEATVYRLLGASGVRPCFDRLSNLQRLRAENERLILLEQRKAGWKLTHHLAAFFAIHVQPPANFRCSSSATHTPAARSIQMATPRTRRKRGARFLNR